MRIVRDPSGRFSRSEPWAPRRGVRRYRCGAEVSRPASYVAGLGIRRWDRDCDGHLPIEEAFSDFSEDDVDGHHAQQCREEGGGQGSEAENVGQWRGGQHRPDSGYAERRDDDRQAGAAAEEGDAPRSDGEDDQRLGGQGFDAGPTRSDGVKRIRRA